MTKKWIFAGELLEMQKKVKILTKLLKIFLFAIHKNREIGLYKLTIYGFGISML